MAVEWRALGLFGRRVPGHVGGDAGRLLPVRLAEDAGETEVDDAQAAVVAEHELRRGQFGVHEALAMGEVEAATGLQPDHQRLRWREVAAAVEQIAQVPTGEVLDDHVDRAAAADLLLAPVVHRGEIGVRDRCHLVHLLAEAAPEFLRLGEFWPDQLDRHGAVELDVMSIGDQRVGAGGDGVQHSIPATDRATVESLAPRGGRRLISWLVVAHVLAVIAQAR